MCQYFMVISQSEARVITEHGINHDIAHSTNMPNVKLENLNSWKDPISPTHRKTMGVFHEQIGVR